ncbi:hypothetical protein [Sphingomonas flavescens]|uniref:hypothetical protein n=1 Tax=Sphingomonas flavescens TaxID=3132797 RepID=UPI002803E7A4|nr:hypothetical protein [Sphingomonas limnosediminicola]
MSGRSSFRSVFMVASCAGAALGCYLVSLRVASERAALEDVESRIVLAQRDMRVLQTEIGTRGRLSQLERWNAGAFALSAPAADQLLKGSFELARLARPDHQVDFKAPMVLASAPAPEKASPIAQPEVDDSGAPAATASPAALMHVASYKTETREVPARSSVTLPLTETKPTGKPATADRSASPKSVGKPGLAAAQPKAVKVASKDTPKSVTAPAKKAVDKPAVPAAKPVTKPVQLAKIDPLAPLPAKHLATSKGKTAER